MLKKKMIPVSIILIFIGVMFVSNANDDKNITVISGTSTADGKSDVRKEVLEECIVSLPRVNDLEAQVTSESRYLKEINGEPNKNEYVKTYTAQIEINYVLFQKVLIIITTSSIQGQEPITKIVEKRLKQSKVFDSNPSEGDIFANRSNRQYFFSSQEKAIEDVKKRAKTWLNQQAAVTCNKK